MCMVNHGLSQRGTLSARVRNPEGFGAGREMWSVWPGPIRFRPGRNGRMLSGPGAGSDVVSPLPES
jgi:hypothetical protein